MRLLSFCRRNDLTTWKHHILIIQQMLIGLTNANKLDYLVVINSLNSQLNSVVGISYYVGLYKYYITCYEYVMGIYKFNAFLQILR